MRCILQYITHWANYIPWTSAPANFHGHSSWPWKRDATVFEDYGLLMMMMMNFCYRVFNFLKITKIIYLTNGQT